MEKGAADLNVRDPALYRYYFRIPTVLHPNPSRQSNGAISLSDGTSIFNSIKALADPMHRALIAMVNKKSAFTSLGVGNLSMLIHQDLIFLKGNVSVFGDAMIALNAVCFRYIRFTPNAVRADLAYIQAPLASSITRLHSSVLGFFDEAIVAYSTM